MLRDSASLPPKPDNSASILSTTNRSFWEMGIPGNRNVCKYQRVNATWLVWMEEPKCVWEPLGWERASEIIKFQLLAMGREKFHGQRKILWARRSSMGREKFHGQGEVPW